MIQPEPLKRTEPARVINRRGVDVSAMFCAAIAGDIGTIERLG